MAVAGKAQMPMGQLGDAFAQLFGAQTLSAITGANSGALGQVGAPTLQDQLNDLTSAPTGPDAEATRKLVAAKTAASESGDPQQSLAVLKTFLKSLS